VAPNVAPDGTPKSNQGSSTNDTSTNQDTTTNP
jgi:hypothetical protein